MFPSDGQRTTSTNSSQVWPPKQFGLFVLGSLGGIALLLTMLGTSVLAETVAVLVGLGLGAGLLLSYLRANVRTPAARVGTRDADGRFSMPRKPRRR